jgi:hypothetical protein
MLSGTAHRISRSPEERCVNLLTWPEQDTAQIDGLQIEDAARVECGAKCGFSPIRSGAIVSGGAGFGRPFWKCWFESLSRGVALIRVKAYALALTKLDGEHS